MIKLPNNLYKDIEETYYLWIITKIDVESFIRVINSVARNKREYYIQEKDKDLFLRSLIIDPFSKDSRRKFVLLEDYFQYAESLRSDPLFTKRKSISVIFRYDRTIQSKRDKKTIREYIIEGSKIEVCPYCNRQYIDIFKKGTKGYQAIGQLDHFYPKEKFPLYALSLYNFVPSCASCNQGKSISHVLQRPFLENSDVENCKPYFKIKPKNLDQLRGSEPVEIDYAFISVDKINQANFFHHKSMYKNHRLLAQRLLRIKRLYNSSYTKQLKELFPKLSDREIKELMFGFNGDSSELLEKPLSKFAHDILGFND